jgi:lysophospholipase L1-like esterase
VIQSISHQELNAELVADVGALYQTWLDNYFSVNPNGLLTGDGVHLSKEGKTALGEFLITLR